MEGSQEPVKPSPEGGPKPGDPTHPFRPPGMEMMLGLGLFFSILLLWGTAVEVAFLQHPQVKAALPEASMTEIREAYSMHGDVMSFSAAWGSGAAALLLLLFVRLWKRKQMATFLGLRIPEAKPALKMTAAFIGLALVLEVLIQFVPSLQDDYTSQILSTTTQPLWFFLGVGVMAPLFEELAFRGLLLGSLRYLMDRHVAIAIASGVFTVLHMQYPWPILLTQVLPLGVMLGYVRTETNSILLPIALHILANSSTYFLAG